MAKQTYPYRTRRRTSHTEGINCDSTWDVNTLAVGKNQSDVSPYLIANEWIAGKIAQFLNLPIPPFSLLKKRDRRTLMFTSYSFQGATSPADLDPEALYREQPDLCGGIIAFDIFVANCDRHPGNIKVDNPAKPKRVEIIDHERALFYIYPYEGCKRLRSRRDRLGISGSRESQDETHCLTGIIDDADLLAKWVHRIATIPKWYIDDICNDVWKVCIKRRECDAAISFLEDRKTRIDTLILSHKSRFSKIKSWPLVLR